MLENTITPEAKIITAKTKDTTNNTKDSTDNIKNTIDNIKDIITLPKTTIEKYKSELDETIKNIELIFESFACEKFMNENFNVRSYNEKDYDISMWSINKLEKDVITLNNIKLCDDMILLETRREMKNMVEDKKVFIDEELISLQLTQIKHVKDIKRELNISVTILITTFIKNITSEITLIEKDDITDTVVNECSNKIKYMIIMKIRYWLVNLCRKKDGTPKTNTSTPKTNTSTLKTNTSTPKTKTNTSTPKTNDKVDMKITEANYMKQLTI